MDGSVDEIEFDNMHRLLSLEIETNQFSINNFLKVGDNISKVEEMGGTTKVYNGYIFGKPITEDHVYSDLGLNVFYNKDNIITRFSVSPLM